MFQAILTRRRNSESRSNRRAKKQCKPIRSRRLALENLETREMFSATPLELYVINDATANISYQYDEAGTALGNSALAAANAAPRGAASMIGVDKTWVIDANRNVYVYNESGGLLGSWSAGSMPNNASPEGIATNGTDVWIVDSRSDKVYRYTGAASRLSGSQIADRSFNLSYGNSTPKDIVTDGASLWVVDDGKTTDRVFKYALTGGYSVGNWTIDAANRAPTGISLDPANIGDMWIADSGTDRVYKYTAAASRNSGSQAAAASFALTTGNTNPQGIAVAGRPWTETPYEVEWVRQFGASENDSARGASADAFGNVYVSGALNDSISSPGEGSTPYLAQFDTAGNLNWMQQPNPPGIGHGGVRVAVDALGNVFQVVGWGSNGDFATLNNYDTSGTLRWSVRLPDGESYFNVEADDLGYAYMATFEGNNIHLRKFDGATGDVLWHDILDTGGFVNASGVSADRMGNIYVAAYTAGAVLGPNAGGYDALLVKYTDAGVRLWTEQFGSSGDDFAFIVAADQSGNVYTSGRTRGSLDGANAGEQDNFLAKHDANGNLQWIRQFGTSGDEPGNGSSGTWVDPTGNIYRSLNTNGALGGAHLGETDIVVAKFNPSGDMLWAMQIGTSGIDLASGDITGDVHGNLYIGGRTTGSMGGANAGGADAVLIKLSPPDTGSGTAAAASLDDSAALSISDGSADSANAIATTSTSTPRRGGFVPAVRPTLSADADVKAHKNLDLRLSKTSAATAPSAEAIRFGSSSAADDTVALDAAFATLEYGIALAI